MVNQIDLGKVYGLQGCPSNRFYNLGSQYMNYPALEEIDNYGNMPRTSAVVSTDIFKTANGSNSNGNGVAGDNPTGDFGNGTTQYSADYPAPATTLGQNIVQNAADDANNSATTTTAATNGYPLGDNGNVQRSSPIREGMNMSMNTGTSQPQQNFGINRGYDVTSPDIRYLNNFMRTQLGRLIEVNFVIGGETMMRVAGYLLGVGDDFVLINEYGTNNVTACDFYNMKYVRFFY